MSLDSALSGDTYTTRVASASRPATPSWTRVSIADRNAASVLPEPVGAAMSALPPPAMRRPRGGLGRRGTAKARVEPGLDGRMELRGGHGQSV